MPSDEDTGKDIPNAQPSKHVRNDELRSDEEGDECVGFDNELRRDEEAANESDLDFLDNVEVEDSQPLPFHPLETEN